MIKITKVLVKNVESNLGTVTGLLNSYIISNNNDTEASVSLYTDNIIIWNDIVEAKKSVRIDLDVILDETVYSISDNDSTNIVLNIIQTN